MATTTGRYWYCSGTTLDFLTVTMVDSTCLLDSEYNDSYCYYKTYKKNITFTLSKALPTPLTVRYQYLYSHYDDAHNPADYTSLITATTKIDAGDTTKVISVTCKEERWCDFSSGGGTFEAPAAIY